MTDRRLPRLTWLLLALLGLAFGGGCGRTDSSTGGEGTETHWLQACSSDQDCEVGQCLCGACTVPCANLLDCPAPLDRCTMETSGGESCEQHVCGSSQPGEITAALQQDSQVDSCIDGRPTSLRLRRDLFGLEGVAVNRDRGFVLWERDSVSWLAGVGSRGNVTQAIWHPSELAPFVSAVAAQPDGSLLTAGTISNFDGNHAWLGQIEPDGSLRWEVDLGRSAVEQLVILEDGGAVIHGLQYEDGREWDDSQFELFWSRVDRDGKILWNNRLPLGAGSLENRPIVPATKLGLLSDQGLRIVESSDMGLTLIQGNLEGAFERSALAATITTVMGVVALPDRRVVVAGLGLTGPTLAFVSPEGSVEHERSYTSGFLRAFTHNAARNELVLVGDSPESGSWMLATDLEGEPVWELSTARLPIDDDNEVKRIPAGRGPMLLDVAAASDGSLLATGLTYDSLVYLLVGAGDCTE